MQISVVHQIRLFTDKKGSYLEKDKSNRVIETIIYSTKNIILFADNIVCFLIPLFTSITDIELHSFIFIPVLYDLSSQLQEYILGIQQIGCLLQRIDES